MSLTPPGQSRRLAIALAGLVTTAALVASTVVGAPMAAAAPSRLAATAQLAPVMTTTTLTTSRNPAYTAQPGGVTAKVKGTTALGVPTGSVDFYVDGQLWWTEPLDATGRARLTFVNLGAGTHSVVAAYGGDTNYAASTSSALSQTVLPTAPTTVLSYTPSTVAPGAVSRLVVAATNQTPVTMPSMAVGVLLPPGARIVSSPPGVGCRGAAPNLYYCLTSARTGVTRKIVIDVTAPSVPATIVTAGYARNLDTMEETSATASLTVGP